MLELPTSIAGTGHLVSVGRGALQRFSRIIPPEPGSSVIPLLRLPPPVTLRPTPPGLHYRNWVQHLAASYRGALQSVDRSNKNGYLLYGDPTKHRHWKRLFQFAMLLDGEGVPPLAWCLFACIVWQARNQGLPTPQFVFSERLFRNQRDWFEELRPSLCAPHVRAHPLHADLYATWQRMRAHLAGIPDLDAREVQLLVEGYFPGDQYEARVSMARWAVKAAQAEIDDAVAAGGFPWQQL